MLQSWIFLSDEILEVLKYPAQQLEWVEDPGDED